MAGKQINVTLEGTGGNVTDVAFGMYKEYKVSSFVLIVMSILMLCIAVSHLAIHKLKLQIVSECGAIIIVGLIGGAFCTLDPSDVVTNWLVGYDPTIFFVALLPPIIFNSGYTMKRRHFFENISSILLFAVVGTFLSSLVIGGFLYVMGAIGLSTNMSIAECLTFGALISSTDPVSTLAVFEKLHVDPKLFYIVFGESVLNDAVSIVLFNTFSKFIGMGPMHPHAISYAILDFFGICLGSTLTGIFFGCLSSVVFKQFEIKRSLMHEVSLFILFAYMPFLVAEVLELSGIVAILFAGMFMKHYTYNNLSPTAQDVTSNFFNVVAFICEMIVFLNLGLSFFNMEKGFSIPFMLWTLVACLGARALQVYPLARAINCVKKEPHISTNEQHMIWFSGLRGAIAFSLSLSFPQPFRNEIRAATMVVVVVTVLVMGGATAKMLRVLEIKRISKEDMEAVGAASGRRNMLLKFDTLYVMPWLTRRSPPPYNEVDATSSTQSTPNHSEHSSSSEAELIASTDAASTDVEDGLPVRRESITSNE